MHLAIATPMYAGQCTAIFNRSVTALALALQNDGSRLTPIYLGNESLIGRARDTLVWHFLNTQASHLLFCDADIGFRVADVARMVAADKDIIVGPCPMKIIHWERVAAAVKAGVAPEDLPKYTGQFNITHLEGQQIGLDPNEPFRIARGGTGFMLIRRRVFETLAPSTPHYINRLPGEAMPPGVQVKHFFPVHVAGDDLLSEDFALCANWIKAGGEVWVAPWVELTHVGTYAFQGVYSACH